MPAGRAEDRDEDGEAERAADLLHDVDQAGRRAGVLLPTPCSEAVVNGTNASPLPVPNRASGPSNDG